MSKKPEKNPKLVVPEGLEWHHRMFEMLGVFADEYDVVPFVFHQPRKAHFTNLEIHSKHRTELANKLSQRQQKPVKLPENGILKMPIESAYAILDDDFDTQVRPASSLFMHPEFEKRYDFVIAYKYEPTGQKDADGDDTYYRHGRVLFLDPLSLSKREWTDPGKRFSLKSEVIFYPSVSKSGHLQISTIHPSGKWIVLARGSAQPPIGEPVTVRLIEKFSTMEAIPYQIGLSSILSEAEMEALEVRALSDQVINKPELPAGCVWDDNEQKPVWDVLNRHWAQLHVKLEASVFGPDMSLEDYRKCNRILRGLLQPDKVAGKSRIVQANRTKRASAVGYFLDVLEAYLEDQADKVTTTVQAPDNGESKPAEPVRELTPEEELRRKRSLAAKKAAETRRQNAAADRKRGKRTKPASA